MKPASNPVILIQSKPTQTPNNILGGIGGSLQFPLLVTAIHGRVEHVAHAAFHIRDVYRPSQSPRDVPTYELSVI
jgi:hypothetical protein